MRACAPAGRGPRRQRRRGPGVRGLRLRAGDGAADAAVVHHPLPALEGAGAVSVPALPGRHLRPARLRPLGPPGHGGGLRRRAGGGRRPGGARRHRHRAVRARGALQQRGARPDPGRRASRAGGRRVLHGAAAPDHPAAPGAHRVPLRRGARDGRGVGQAERPLLGSRLSRLRGVLLRAVLPGAALDQADRGLRGMGARGRPPHAGPHHPRTRDDARARGRAARPSGLPGRRLPGGPGRAGAAGPERRVRAPHRGASS